MNKEKIDHLRNESKQAQRLAEDLLAQGSGSDALKVAFYAGIKEGDAQAAEDQLERSTRTITPQQQAAGEMYEALVKASKWVCGCHDTADTGWHSPRCFIPAVRAALAKVVQP